MKYCVDRRNPPNKRLLTRPTPRLALHNRPRNRHRNHHRPRVPIRAMRGAQTREVRVQRGALRGRRHRDSVLV